MPIDSYTTKIEPSKTVQEIQTLLVNAGASHIMVAYEKTRPTQISFAIVQEEREIAFNLPVNAHGVYLVISQDESVSPRLQNYEQAERVAWRQVKKWIEAQLAFIEANQATFAQLFLPFAIAPDGKTVYEKIYEGHLLIGNQMKMLEGEADS